MRSWQSIPGWFRAAMVSYPSFDPNVFSARITTATWKKLQAEGNPFVNRALQGFPRFHL
ncbi:MAG UNVERIFIED_CONTAM: hypothetical protein LVR29_23470 [Microcystis novacekii LVE1205-3]